MTFENFQQEVDEAWKKMSNFEKMVMELKDSQAELQAKNLNILPLIPICSIQCL